MKQGGCFLNESTIPGSAWKRLGDTITIDIAEDRNWQEGRDWEGGNRRVFEVCSLSHTFYEDTVDNHNK